MILPAKSTGETEKLVPLQITCEIPLILANGFTVIVIVKADPKQFPCGDLGVTVYVAVRGAAVVLLMIALKDEVLAIEPVNGLNPATAETVQL
jgi:hypothetical protein